MQDFFSAHQVRQDDYNLNSLVFRLKKIQKILNKIEIPQLLIINGQDSNYNPENIKFTNWLLKGLSGNEILTDSFQGVEYDSLILLISQDSIQIYTEEASYEKLKDLVYGIPNCDVFRANTDQLHNLDELELVKLSYFYKITQNQEKIGVILPVGVSNVKSVEKWPLIQAYALCGGGFFSMSHKLVDLKGQVNGQYRNIDKPQLYNLLNEKAVRLQGYIYQTFEKIKIKSFKQRETLDIQQLNEVLQQYYEIQQQQHSKLSKRVSENPNLQGSYIKSNGTLQRATVVNIDAVDYSSKLRAVRTYFLNNNLESKEFLLYKKLVDTFYILLEQISQTHQLLDPAKIQPYITKTLQTECTIALESYNAFGDATEINFKNSTVFKLASCIYVLKIILPQQNIQFAESFTIQGNSFFVLTQNVKIYDFASINGNNEEETDTSGYIYQQNKDNILSLLKCQVIVNENDIIIETNEFGSVTLHYDYMKDIEISQQFSTLPWVKFIYNGKDCFNIQNNTVYISFNNLEILEKFKNTQKVTVQNESKNNYIYVQQIFPELLLNQDICILEDKTYIQAQYIKNRIIQNNDYLEYINMKQLLYLNNSKDIKFEEFINKTENNEVPDNIHVILVNGPHSSGKRVFVRKLFRFSKEIKQKMFSFQLFNNEMVDEKHFIKQLINFAKINSVQENNLVVCVVPSCFSTKILVDLFTKNEKVNQLFHIRSIVTKINVNNFFLKNQQAQQNLMGLLHPGYSQKVILDSLSNTDEENENICKIINSVNRKQVIRIESNAVSQQMAVNLLTNNSFNSADNNFLRSKNYVFNEYISNKEEFIFVPFKIMINRSQFLKMFYRDLKLKGYMLDLDSISQQVEQYRSENKFSRDVLQQEMVKLKEKILTIDQIKDKKTMQINQIQGIIRFEDFELIDISINLNYYNDKNLKEVTHKIFNQKENGKSMKNASYTNFSNPEQMGLVFHGFNLNKNVLLDLLYSCTKQFPFKKNIQELDEQTKKQEILENRGNYLPYGVYYDGKYWRDEEGNLITEHPCEDKILQARIEKENDKINECNRTITMEQQEYRTYYNQIVIN